MEYNVYSEFDIDKHAEVFINYLEVMISSEGKIHYAVPSHQMFLENILKKKWGEKKFYQEVDSLNYLDDYFIWLCSETGYIGVWNNFIRGEPNDKQREALEKLSNKKYTKVNSYLYKGYFLKKNIKKRK